jgi:hypothetical protein
MQAKEGPQEGPKENSKKEPTQVVKPKGFILPKVTKIASFGPSTQDLETKVVAAPQAFSPPTSKIGMFAKTPVKNLGKVATKITLPVQVPKPKILALPTASTTVLVKPAVATKALVKPKVPAPMAAPLHVPILEKYEFPETLPSNTRTIITSPDGLCFYRAILKSLEQNPQNDANDTNDTLKRSAIGFATEIGEWLKANRAECEKQFNDAFLTGNQHIWEQGVQVKMSYNDYIDKIIDPDLSVYPELEFCTGRAAAELKNVQIGVYYKIPGEDTYRFTTQSFGNSGKPVFIQIVGNNHFDLLLPDFTQVAPLEA